jgi:chromosome segregation ATPase
MRAIRLAAFAALLLAPRAQVLAQEPVFVPAEIVAPSGHDVVVVMDCSFAGGNPANKLLLGQWVVSDVLDAIPGGVPTALIVCGREAESAASANEVVRPLGPMEWTDKASLRRSMTRLRPGQVEGLSSGLSSARQMLARRGSSQKTVVVVCDGEEIGQSAAQYEVGRLAQEQRAQLHVVGLAGDMESRAGGAGRHCQLYSVQSSRDLDSALKGMNRTLSRMSEPRTITMAQAAPPSPSDTLPPPTPDKNNPIDPRSVFHRDALIQKLTAEILQYKESADSLAREKAAAEATAAAQAKQIKEMTGELRVVHGEMEKKDLRIQQLNTELGARTAELAARVPHAAQHGAQMSALQATIKKQSDEIRMLDELVGKKEQDLIALRAKLDEAEKANKALQKARDEAEGIAKKMSDQLSELMREYRAAAAELGKLRKALETVTQQRDAERERRARAEKEVERLTAENKTLSESLAESERKLSMLTQSEGAVRASAAAMSGEMASLTKELQVVKHELDKREALSQQLMAEVATGKAKMREVMDALGLAEAGVVAREKQLKDRIIEFQRTQEFVKEREIIIQKLTGELALAKKEAEDKGKKIEGFELRGMPHFSPQQMHSLVEAKAAAEVIVAQQAKQIGILQTQVDALRCDLERRDGLVMKLNMDLSAERQKVHELGMLTKELHHKAAVIENQLQASQFESRELKEKVLHLTESKHERETRLHAVQATLQAKELELVTLRKELEACAHQICVVKEMGQREVLLEGARKDAVTAIQHAQQICIVKEMGHKEAQLEGARKEVMSAIQQAHQQAQQHAQQRQAQAQNAGTNTHVNLTVGDGAYSSGSSAPASSGSSAPGPCPPAQPVVVPPSRPVVIQQHPPVVVPQQPPVVVPQAQPVVVPQQQPVVVPQHPPVVVPQQTPVVVPQHPPVVVPQQTPVVVPQQTPAAPHGVRTPRRPKHGGAVQIIPSDKMHIIPSEKVLPPPSGTVPPGSPAPDQPSPSDKPPRLNFRIN